MCSWQNLQQSYDAIISTLTRISKECFQNLVKSKSWSIDVHSEHSEGSIMFLIGYNLVLLVAVTLSDLSSGSCVGSQHKILFECAPIWSLCSSSYQLIESADQAVSTTAANSHTHTSPKLPFCMSEKENFSNVDRGSGLITCRCASTASDCVRCPKSKIWKTTMT